MHTTHQMQREHRTITLEQRSSNEVENTHFDVRDEQLQALLGLPLTRSTRRSFAVVGSRSRERRLEELQERQEGELVHRTDVLQVFHEEEDAGTGECEGTVDIALFVEFDAGGGTLDQRVFDFGGFGLGLRERLDERGVLEEIALGGCEGFEEVLLQTSKLHLPSDITVTTISLVIIIKKKSSQ